MIVDVKGSYLGTKSMSEIVGATELQEMEADVKLLQAKFKKVKEAENMCIDPLTHDRRFPC